MTGTLKPYRPLPVLADPPQVYASCRRCEWAILEQHCSDKCELHGGRDCSAVNAEGECRRWMPRRSWWRRLLGIGAP